MRIVCIYKCYNEIKLLPWQYAHCKKNNIEMFVIDNMSNDGTTEYLKEKDIPHVLINTDDSFDLRPIFKLMNSKLHEIKPDWFIYGDGDLFYEAPEGLFYAIEKADKEGFTQLQMNRILFPNVGQGQLPGNPFINYTYVSSNREYKHALISKYCPSINIIPDIILRDNNIIKPNAGIMFEMHASKTGAERMETLRRREKAWNNGLNKDLGFHYRIGAQNNFIYDKEKCIDISEYKNEFELYKRLQSLKKE